MKRIPSLVLPALAALLVAILPGAAEGSRALTVVHPPADAHLKRGPLRFHVNLAPDSLVVAVTLRMEGPLNRLGPVTMERITAWSWRFPWDARNAETGPYLLHIKAADADGGTLAETNLAFLLMDGELPRPSPGSDWPMAGADPARTGTARDVITPPLHLAWATPLDGRPGCGSPVLRDGFLYVGTCGVPGEEDGAVVAIDAESGARLWREPTAGAIRHALCVDGENIYAFSAAGDLIALDPWNGMERWTAPASRRGRTPLVGAPLLLPGLLCAGDATDLAAVRIGTGEAAWRAQPFSPRGSASGEAFDHPSVPALGDGMIFIAGPEGLASILRDTGAVRWRTSSPAGSVAFRNGQVYGVEGGSRLVLEARDARLGSAVWSTPLGDELDGIPAAAPVVSEDFVILAGRTRLFAFDRQEGALRWSRAIVGPPARSTSPNAAWLPAPVISGETVFAVTREGRLYALHLATGKHHASIQIGAPVSGSPAVSGNTLYLATDDGMLYAFVADRGAD